jgi:hypothetical protein
VKRRLLAIIATLSMLLAIVPATPASAYFVAGCHPLEQAGKPENNWHAYLATHPTGQIDYMRAQIDYLRDVAVCTGDNIGKSWVLPVNIQGSDVLVQFGYGRSATTSGGALRWFYTPDASSSPLGIMTVPAALPNPVVGHRYVLYIAFRSGEGNRWKFTLDDVTTGGRYSFYATAGNHVESGNEAWSGFEVYNTNDQLGGATDNTYITNIGFSGPNIDFMYFNSYLAHVHECCGTDQPYWYSSSDAPSGRAWIRAHTNDHGE